MKTLDTTQETPTDETDAAGSTVADAGNVEGEIVADGAKALEAGGADVEQVDENLIQAGEIPGLPAQVQETVNRRIGKMTAKYRGAEEAAQAAKAERDAAQARVTELETAKDTAIAGEAVRLGVHPEYVSEQEVKLLNTYDALMEQQGLLMDSLDDGYTDAQGKTYSREETRRAWREVTQRLSQVAPQAESLKRDRVQQMMRHMRLGREAEKANWTPGAKAIVKAEGAGKATVVPKPPVAVGARGSSAPGRARTGDPKPRTTFSQESMAAKGGGRRALQSLYEEAG